MPTPTLDLPGRLPQTRTHHGNPDATYTLRINGADLYRLQQFLEEAATEAHGYLRIRECVMLAELVRSQITTQKGNPCPTPSLKS